VTLWHKVFWAATAAILLVEVFVAVSIVVLLAAHGR